jgi:microsomal dipeptidase-like Zn-dependent dipeptidase
MPAAWALDSPSAGDLDKLDILFDEGLRIAGLTHFFDNELGGSLHGVSGEGLTPFGREVIERANELGMIIDVAHASPRMVSDVLDLSDAPVVLSHGGIKSACDVGRNLDDDLMQRIAERGGIAGIGFWDGAVCDFTPAGVARSIRKAVAVMGIDHVALGSDYDGATEVMFDASELAILTQALLDAGLSDTEVAKVMGENALRFFLDNLPDA